MKFTGIWAGGLWIRIQILLGHSSPILTKGSLLQWLGFMEDKFSGLVIFCFRSKEQSVLWNIKLGMNSETRWTTHTSVYFGTSYVLMLYISCKISYVLFHYTVFSTFMIQLLRLLRFGPLNCGILLHVTLSNAVLWIEYVEEKLNTNIWWKVKASTWALRFCH